MKEQFEAVGLVLPILSGQLFENVMARSDQTHVFLILLCISQMWWVLLWGTSSRALGDTRRSQATRLPSDPLLPSANGLSTEVRGCLGPRAESPPF